MQEAYSHLGAHIWAPKLLQCLTQQHPNLRCLCKIYSPPTPLHALCPLRYTMQHRAHCRVLLRELQPPGCVCSHLTYIAGKQRMNNLTFPYGVFINVTSVTSTHTHRCTCKNMQTCESAWCANTKSCSLYCFMWNDTMMCALVVQWECWPRLERACVSVRS